MCPALRAGCSLPAEPSRAFPSRSAGEPPTTDDLAYVPVTQTYGPESSEFGPPSTSGGGIHDSYSPGARPQPAFPSPFAVRGPPLSLPLLPCASRSLSPLLDVQSL